MENNDSTRNYVNYKCEIILVGRRWLPLFLIDVPTLVHPLWRMIYPQIFQTQKIFLFDSAIISCWNCSRDTLQRTPCYILFLKTQFAKNQFLFVGWLRLVYNSAVSNYAKKYRWYLQCDIAQIEISLISHVLRRNYLNIIGKLIWQKC